MSLSNARSDPLSPEYDPDASTPPPRHAARGRLAGLDADARRRLEAAALALLAPPNDADLAQPSPSEHPRPVPWTWDLEITFRPVRHARRSVGLTITELAGRAGIAESTLRRVETDRTRPSTATLARIGLALGMSDPRDIATLWAARPAR